MSTAPTRPASGGVATFLRARAEVEPDRPFVRCGGPWISAAELHEAAGKVAAGLASLGVGPGDRVASIATNRQEAVELIFGIARVGAIQVPINSFLKGEFLRYQLADSEADVLVCDAEGWAAAAPVLTETSVKTVVLLDSVDEQPAAPSTTFAELRESPDTPPDPELDASDPFAIIYTSGTTGLPKGCVLTHGSYTAGTKAFEDAGWVIGGDRIFTAFPLFHTSGQIISLMNALVVGDSVCFEPAFSPATFVSRAAEEEATVLQGVGPMAMAILSMPPGDADREHGLRLASFIPLDPKSQAAFTERFGVRTTAEAYGQTEANPVTIGSLDADGRPGSAGQASSNFEVRIVDAQDRAVPTGEVGEITVRPREPWTMFSGYWNKAEATVDAFANLWHHTGDAGRLDDDGYLFFVDRKKDALRRRGENISSFELEAAISKHPGVAQVAVVAEPSPLGEDDVRACIVAVPDQELTPEALFEHFKASIPYFAVPRYVEVRESLPANAMGRVMKHKLREEGVDADAWDFEAMGLTVAKEERR